MIITRRSVYIIITILLIGLVGFLIIYSLTPRSTIQWSVAPEEVFVSIDGGSKQLIKNKQSTNVTPGKHTVKVFRDEFDSFSKDIIIKDKQTIEVIVALNPSTEAAKKLMLTTGADEVVQRFYGEKLVKESIQLDKDYPILSILPIEARLYVVNPCKSVKYPNDSTKIALCVDAYHEGLEPYVNKHITSLGFNPADYEIIFVNKYDNPIDE